MCRSMPLKRISTLVRAAGTMHRRGLTLRSIILYPVRRRLLNDARCQVDFRDGLSIVSPRDEPPMGLFNEVWGDQCYAPGGLRLSPGDTVVDIGANIGIFSLWAARTPGIRLIAVEPSPLACRFLHRNLLGNSVKGFEILQCACAGRSGTAPLYSRGRTVVNTLFSQDLCGSSFRALGHVPLLTLDQLFHLHAIEECAFLKMDCEGAEYEILYAASEVMLRRIRRIAMEYHVGLNQHSPGDLARFLEAHGFKVDLRPFLDVEGGYLYADRHGKR